MSMIDPMIPLFAAMMALGEPVPVTVPVTGIGMGVGIGVGLTHQESDRVVWYDNLNEARRVAQRDGKHLLIDFTGSGWCVYCKRLHEEVFTKPAFHDAVMDSFVCVTLDFDEQLAARRDRPHPEQSDQLREALGIVGLPTVALMSTKGVVYDQLEYQQGGAAPFVQGLEAAYDRASFLEEKVPLLASGIARAKSAEDAAKVADDATLLLSQAGAHPLATPLIPLVKAVLKRPDLKPERERAAIAALSAAEVVDDELIQRAFELDPANAEGLPEAALAGAFRGLSDPERARDLIAKSSALLRAGASKDVAVAAQLYGDCAFYSSRLLKDPDGAAIFARYALSLEPKDPQRRRMLEDLSAGR